MKINIPKTTQYGWHIRTVQKRLEILDGWYEIRELVFDPTVEEATNRVKFCIQKLVENGKQSIFSV